MSENIKEFTPEVMAELNARAVGDVDITSREIPDLDLYIDQILTLVSGKTAQSSDRYKENHLTKTMINNYSKEGLIMPVKGKKYTKEQIIQILFIYTLKGTLSIGEIKRMLEGAYAIKDFDGDRLVGLYDKYTNTKEQIREYSTNVADKMLEACGLDIENEEDFLAAIINFVAMSAFMKNIAQAMISERYPEPVAESDSEKKEKSKDKDKKEKKDKKDKKEKKADEF